jgi:AraC-like DNA-binding protein
VDVLSDAIAATRLGRPHSSRTQRRAPWAVRFAPYAGAGFHVVLQGSCWLLPEGAEPVALEEGDVVFLPHGLGHGLADAPATAPAESGSTPLDGALPDQEVPPDGRTVLLCGGYLLDQARPHPLWGELPDVFHVPARAGGHGSLRLALNLLGEELARPQPGADAALPALLDALLLYLLRAWLEQQAADRAAGGPGAGGWAAALTDPAVTAALRAIHREEARPWTVESLGREAGLSRAAFARRFLALVGQPPLAYLTWWRMTRAAQLLRDSSATVGAIAHEVGYTSEFAFARAFKRSLGTAPGAYRRVQREAGAG